MHTIARKSGLKLSHLCQTLLYRSSLNDCFCTAYLVIRNFMLLTRQKFSYEFLLSGAFLIPYVIMLAIEGIPIFYLELALGQRLRKGAIGAWNEVSPYLGGIGIASAMVSFWVSLYYNTIIAWCLYYLVRSFSTSLPWAECPDTTIGNETVPVKECEVSH